MKTQPDRHRPRALPALLLAISLGASVAIAGCSAPAPAEPLPPPVVVAPEPIPEPEPEPEPEFTAWLPFNGEGVDEDDPRLTLRPLAVKIENSPSSRPSMGLSYADVVYETITEGGITRFCAIFHSFLPNETGSTRSARNSDISIVPQYDGLFVFSGTNSVVWQLVRSTIRSHLSEGNAGPAFYRVQQKVAPHNLYFSPELGYERFEELGHEIETDGTVRELLFGENDLAGLGGSRAHELYVPFSAPIFNVTWLYEEEEGAYFRYIDGVEQVDESDATKQVRAENVVILSAAYLAGGGNGTFILNLNGEGDAILFQDGMRVEATWHTDGTHPPILKDKNGDTLYFKPGQTWFQVPADFGAVESS
ncbi:MAG: DUF3048 domain-containing protein [Clostridiales bacterium]|nr:DUF3048 domain-containing protein [Clostridiales bacterium]